MFTSLDKVSHSGGLPRLACLPACFSQLLGWLAHTHARRRMHALRLTQAPAPLAAPLHARRCTAARSHRSTRLLRRLSPLPPWPLWASAPSSSSSAWPTQTRSTHGAVSPSSPGENSPGEKSPGENCPAKPSLHGPAHLSCWPLLVPGPQALAFASLQGCHPAPGKPQRAKAYWAAMQLSRAAMGPACRSPRSFTALA